MSRTTQTKHSPKARTAVCSNSESPQPQPAMTQNGTDSFCKGDQDEYAKMMKRLVNNKEFSDLKFLIGPSRKPVFAHRCILSARCPVFKAMFAEKAATGEKDIPFVLSDMSMDVFLLLLEFIYTNCVTLSSKSTIDVLATSLEYGLDDLRNICVDYLDANLSINNACDVIQAAVTYNQKDLKDKVMIFIEDNTTGIFKSKGFQEISEDTLVSVLRSSRLEIDEMDIFKAVKEWATVNSVINGRKVFEVARNAVKHIRFPLLSADELTALEEDSKKDHFIPVGEFAYAWKLHALKQGDKGNILSILRRGTSTRDHHKFLNDQNSK